MALGLLSYLNLIFLDGKMNKTLNRLNKEVWDKLSANLCQLLKWQSLDTWDRIEFVRGRKWLKIYEPTITQNILYSFAKAKKINPKIPLLLFEAVNERTNGNDIELLIKTQNGKYIQVPVQAKILYPSLMYNQIGHSYTRKTPHKYQIDALLEYAKAIKGIPLYLLYNGMSDEEKKIYGFGWMYKGGKRYNIKQFGCSLVSAHYIRSQYFSSATSKWESLPSFNDLHPSIAWPWWILGCNSLEKVSTNSIVDLLLYTGITKTTLDYTVLEKRYEDLRLSDDWLEFGAAPTYFASERSERNEIGYEGFSPRYRIVIGSLNNQSNG